MAIAKGRTLIIDTDGGTDDLLAICALRNTKSVNIPFISTVGGLSNDPARIARFLKQELVEPDVITGQRSKINEEYTVDWLGENRRKLDNLMNSFGVKSTSNTEYNNPNISDEVSKFLMDQPDQSVDLMCLGPMTNVASWIECDKTRLLLESKVAEIWIMGGNKPTSNLESKAEFNFYTDPASSAKVIGCKSLNDRMYVVSDTLCNSLSPSAKKWENFVQKGKNNKGLIEKVLNANSGWDDLKFDPVCAFAYANPNNRKVETLELKISPKNDPPYGSLLLQPESGDSNTLKLKFVTDVTIDSDDGGFLQWLTEAIEVVWK